MAYTNATQTDATPLDAIGRWVLRIVGWGLSLGFVALTVWQPVIVLSVVAGLAAVLAILVVLISRGDAPGEM